MARKNSFNRKNKVKEPKRKIGRYVLVLFLLFPMALKLKSYDLSQWVPDMNLALNFEETIEQKIEQNVQVASVIIEGDLTYTNKDMLKNAIVKQLGENFVNTNLASMKEAALAIPWVRTASVSRVWPKSIKIIIEEQQPIARWGAEGFVNRYGSIVIVEDTSLLDHLPVLKGPQIDAYDIAREYLVFANLLSEYQLYVSSLLVDDSGEWNIEVNRSFHIALGKHDLSKRLERFIYVFNHQLSGIESEIALVDLRYKKGLAVKWKTNTQTLDTSKKTLVSG